MHAFFVTGWTQPPRLTDADIHHLTRVLRLRPGESVLLLDGVGGQAAGKIVSVAKNSVELELTEPVTRAPRPEPAMTLALGWGKAARRGFLLEKSVEFEAGGIWFWQAERSQFPLPEPDAAGRESWRAQLMAGAKQCRNPWLPELQTLPGGLRRLVEQSEGFANKFVLLGENEAKETSFLDEKLLDLPGDRLCVLGPEGGLSQKEIQTLLAHGFAPISLGKRVLRWESAALLCLGLHWWRRQNSRA